MTGLIGLSCPASLKMQDRTGSPFGRKSPPVQEPFDATIDSTEAGSFRWAAPTEKCSWSYPFSANPVSPALGGRGSRNCRLSSSQVPVAKSTVGLATNPGLPFSGWVWGPEARLGIGTARMSSRRTTAAVFTATRRWPNLVRTAEVFPDRLFQAELSICGAPA